MRFLIVLRGGAIAASLLIPQVHAQTQADREWINANTAILYAYSQWFMGDDQGELDANFLFTLKFDADGNWKIVKTHQMSEKELKEEQ